MIRQLPLSTDLCGQGVFQSMRFEAMQSKVLQAQQEELIKEKQAQIRFAKASMIKNDATIEQLLSQVVRADPSYQQGGSTWEGDPLYADLHARYGDVMFQSREQFLFWVLLAGLPWKPFFL